MSTTSIDSIAQSDYPVEFTVSGVPISLQSSSRSKELWKVQVQTAARECVSGLDEFILLDNRPLAVTIYVFLNAPMLADIDNIAKPILDSLKRIIYRDDRIIERLIVQKFEPGTNPQFSVPTERLARVLDEQLTSRLEQNDPVVYIRIDDNLSWRRIE